jgi:hypothetical protein
VRRAGAAAEHGGDAAHQRFLDLLRADEVDMRVDAAGGDDLALAGDASVPGPMMMVTPAACRDCRPCRSRDAAVLEADIGLDDAGYGR